MNSANAVVAAATTDATGFFEGGLAIAVAEFGEASEPAVEAQNNLAVLYKYWGRFEQGLQLYRKAQRSISSLHGEESLASGVVYHNIGGILHAQGLLLNDSAQFSSLGTSVSAFSRKD